MSEPEAASALGPVLEGRYRLITVGSTNDLGVLCKAHDMEQDQLVVVLVLDPRWGNDLEALQYVQQAQGALASLAVPGLIPYEHVGMADGWLYLVRARQQGQSLADLLAQIGRLEVNAAVDLAIQVCDILAPAHHAGCVHGGLTPRSIMVGQARDTSSSPRPAVKLLDCGLVPALHASGEPQGRPWGRFPYLSPEQAAGEEAHPTSDVYVIGSLLYEMLAGRPPFRSNDETVLALQHLRQEPPSLQILVPHVPPALAQIVQKALAKEPAARYRNAGQLAQILRTQLGRPAAARPPTSAAAQQLPARERLVVPAPPAPSRAAAQPSWQIYDLDQAEAAEEPGGVDWLMITLLIAALIAVLGLIPLWRTVYRRYAAPAPAAYDLIGAASRLAGTNLACDLAEESADLELWGAFCHDPIVASALPARPALLAQAVAGGALAKLEKFSGLGVELTGFERRA